MSSTLRVVECFVSLQGESTFAGLPCAFIRLAGCNLRCAWCDTAYAWEPEAGEERPIPELVAWAEDSGVPMVEVTGGEPLLQAATPELLRRLQAAGFTVLLETNGAVPLDRVPPGVHRIMDRKLPASGMADRHLAANYQLLTPEDEIKFVVADALDYDFMRREIETFRLPERTPKLLASPVWGRLEPAELAAWILRDRLPVRFQLQLHKIIWSPELRGV